MGQAKRRGSFDDRKREALEKLRLAELKRQDDNEKVRLQVQANSPRLSAKGLMLLATLASLGGTVLGNK